MGERERGSTSEKGVVDSLGRLYCELTYWMRGQLSKEVSSADGNEEALVMLKQVEGFEEVRGVVNYSYYHVPPPTTSGAFSLLSSSSLAVCLMATAVASAVRV